MTDAARVEGLTKVYARYSARRRFSTLKSALLGGSFFRDLEPGAAFTALDDVSFRVRAGATVAIVGPNGSGKSTLLKVLAGVLRPTRGTVEVRGRVAALLELGAGFHPEVSGRENIVINGIMLGLGRREIESRIAEVVRFAELEDFIDAPVKTYSSGMYVRLGFSVAVAVEPDVLLVDEVLAVGDEAFSHRCIDRFRDLKRRGRTVLLVTHALDLAAGLADEVLLLEGGRLTGQGLPREIVDRYRGHVAVRETRALAAGNAARDAPAGAGDPGPAAAGAGADGAAGEAAAGSGSGALPDAWRPRRWGNRAVEIAAVRVCGGDGGEQELFHTGDTLVVDLDVIANTPQEDFVFGVAIHSREGHVAYGTNTTIEGFRPRRLEGRARVQIAFPDLRLLDGSYALDVAVHTREGVAFDYRHACRTFAVRSAVSDAGIARLDHAWSFTGGVAIAAPGATG